SSSSHELGKKRRAAACQHVARGLSADRKCGCRICLSQSQPVLEIFALVERNRTCSQWRECARVRLLRRAQTSPANATGKTKAIEPFGIVIGDAGAKNCRFPGGQRQLAAVKLLENRLQTFGAF